VVYWGNVSASSGAGLLTFVVVLYGAICSVVNYCGMFLSRLVTL